MEADFQQQPWPFVCVPTHMWTQYPHRYAHTHPEHAYTHDTNIHTQKWRKKKLICEKHSQRHHFTVVWRTTITMVASMTRISLCCGPVSPLPSHLANRNSHHISTKSDDIISVLLFVSHLSSSLKCLKVTELPFGSSKMKTSNSTNRLHCGSNGVCLIIESCWQIFECFRKIRGEKIISRNWYLKALGL